MSNDAGSRRGAFRELVGSVGLGVAALLVVFGFFLPSHDYAGLGDPVLDRIVSSDARDSAALLAIATVLIAGTTMVVVRSRGFVIASAVILVLGLINLVRLAPYY
ncbi:hypothetical protein ACIBL3_04460 [Kribbella sp. NPDC050124]|uniref:hypothetical protein n=1 Tax=Kribbella sp. NPDC050124 TaxID=3364114 RepID=UPI0037BD4D82